MLKDIMVGMLIGLANIIPGVSGGTIAVTMGVYDELISAITGFRKDAKKSIQILLPYLIGGVIGVGGLSFVVQYALKNYPLQTNVLFIGLILGGLPLIFKKASQTNGAKKTKISPVKVFLSVLFFLLIIGVAFVKNGDSGVGDVSLDFIVMIKLFLVGVIASATMVIPGISGSLVMMMLGFYEIIINNISGFIKGILIFDMPNVFHSTWILLPFGVGVLIGIGLIAKLMELLFEKLPGETYSAILGLVIGTPVVIIYSMGKVNVTGLGVVGTIVTFIVGFIVAFRLGEE